MELLRVILQGVEAKSFNLSFYVLCYFNNPDNDFHDGSPRVPAQVFLTILLLSRFQLHLVCGGWLLGVPFDVCERAYGSIRFVHFRSFFCGNCTS